jgi:ankyrin repeat protein
LFGLKNTAEELLSRGRYSARQRNTYGRSALALAAVRGFLGVIQVLLVRTVEVESRDHIGRTPASLAAEFGYTEIVKALVDHGAEPNTEDNFNRYPPS